MYTKILKNNVKLKYHKKWQKNSYFYKKIKLKKNIKKKKCLETIKMKEIRNKKWKKCRKQAMYKIFIKKEKSIHKNIKIE